MYLKVGNISYLFTMADKNEILAIVLHSCGIYSDRTNFVQNRGPTATHLSRSQEFKKVRIKLQIQPKREEGIFGVIPNENIPWTYEWQ